MQEPICTSRFDVQNCLYDCFNSRMMRSSQCSMLATIRVCSRLTAHFQVCRAQSQSRACIVQSLSVQRHSQQSHFVGALGR